ncbi:MAG: ribonuclease H-like YkuK family protein [Candidatus Yanofskybacteria bacterium]|nr:ribonuclease H-like YkuK family protein [Candidatus Yanofskybacteria bacterium]
MNDDGGHSVEYFVSPSRGKRDFLGSINDIVEFINEDVVSKYAVVVGTDSDETVVPNGHAGLADFVSVITVHRIGKHGRYFWKRIPNVQTFDRHDRMLKEAYYSLELAQRVVAQLRKRLNSQLYDFEIHLDIGLNGPTKSMIQEIVGMITGNGFTARIKPDSYAANKVADRHV